MSRFLLALAALAGGLFLGLAPPAGAASPRGGWSSPAVTGDEAGTPVGTLQRPGPITGWAEFDKGIDVVGFTLVEDPSKAGEPCSARGRVLPQSAPGGANRVEFAFDAPFPCNRRYQVRATVAPRQGPLGDDTNLVLNLLVDVALPPAPAAGVVAELADDRTVTARWGSEPQAPDFEGYLVERAVGDEPFRKVGEVGATQTSFLDGGVPDEGGTLRYRVIAKRPGPRGDTTVFAEASSSAVVDVPALPGESTAGDGDTEAEGAGGGSGGGGTGGTGGARDAGGTASTVRRNRPGTITRRTTATTIDTGFQESLPFDQSASPTASPTATPPGDPAVVARIDDDSDDEGRRQTMLLLAGGTTAFSWAMLLRFVTRRALIV